MKKTSVEQESVLRRVTGAAEFKERRRTARMDIPLKVEYRIQTTDHRPQTTDRKKGVAAVTKDVSVGGCLLLVKEEIPLNSVVELKLFLGSKKEEALLLKGKVVRLHRKEKGLYEYGLAFDGLSSEARRLFADFCFAKMYEMIGLSSWPTAREQKT